jgi:hypothetical protein
MSHVTLEAVQAKQTELAAMIQHLLMSATKTSVHEIEAGTIELQPGERYAGAVLDADGQHLHHLVLMAQRPTDKLKWQAAMDWAARVGGSLPTRQEQSLLFANCKPHLQPEWHWSCEVYEEDASYAWYCLFSYGYITSDHKSVEGSAVAVRRFL